MIESKLSNLVKPLEEILFQYDTIIKGYREKSGVRVAGISCDFLPLGIFASFGIVPLRIPSFLTGHFCGCSALSDIDNIGDLYDLLIMQDGCAQKSRASGLPLPVYEFKSPGGYGEDASIKLHNEMNSFLKSAGIKGIDTIDIAKLQAITGEYNVLRRFIRGITSIRKEKPDLLSNCDLITIFDASLILPPSVTAEYLAVILDAMNKETTGYKGGLVPALIYSSFIRDGSLLDEIEEAGCLICEDDSCNGRRQFDMSFNHSSTHLYYEIIDAFSYRPLCPSVRPAEERFELFYKLLKSHGIETVIFLEDLCCGSRKRDIDFLRVRLMRSGVDPIVVASQDAVEKVKEYVRVN